MAHLFMDAVIETDRLLIRPYRLEDAPALHQAVASPGFYDYIPGESTPTLREVEDVIQWSISCCSKNTKERIYKFNLGIIHKGTQQLIGYCGLGPYDLEPSKIELYYVRDIRALYRSAPGGRSRQGKRLNRMITMCERNILESDVKKTVGQRVSLAWLFPVCRYSC